MTTLNIKLDKTVYERLKNDYFLKKSFIENHKKEINRLFFIKRSLMHTIDSRAKHASKYQLEDIENRMKELNNRIDSINRNCGAVRKLKEIE